MTSDRYDRVAYEGGARSTSHPDRIATTARLFGRTPADVETARVLELGCGDGSNLLPIAHDLPGSTCVGVDLAAEPIERGRQAARQLAIANVELLRGDLRDLPAEIGDEFDYVIAHGVYSWIPEDARDALMAACSRLLAPNGVAFVSYNAYPGSHVRDAIREILAYAVGQVDDPELAIDSARRVLQLLAGSGNQEPLAQALSLYAARLLERPPWLLYHDELAPICDAFYLHEFTAHAESHGLEYLFESCLSHGVLGGISSEAAEALSTLPDVVTVREQFVDFVVNRLFRESLLCRGPLGAGRSVDTGALSSMRVAARVGDAKDGLLPVGNGSIEARHGEVVDALARVGTAWPRSVPFDEIATDSAGTIAAALLDLHMHGLVELELRDVQAVRPGAMPKTSAWNRWQVRAGHAMVTNARHEDIRLQDDLGRQLIGLLDGTRDIAALASELDVEPQLVSDALDRLADLALLRG